MTTAGIKLTLDVGDAVSAAGRYEGSLHRLNEEIKNAEQLAKSTGKSEDWDNFAKLTFSRDRMQHSSSAFDKSLKTLANSPKFQTQGPNGQTVFKADPEFVSLFKNNTDTLKKLIAAHEAALRSGDVGEAQNLAFQIEKQQKEFSEAVENATGTGTRSNGVGEAVKSIFAQQIVGAIKNGMDVWVSSIDRTGIINAAGGGDVLGASLAERQRRTNRTSGILDTAGAAAQGIGAALAPFTGGGSLIAGTAINLVTGFFKSLNEAEQKKYANRIAYSSLWDDKKDQAMNLAAITGDPSNVRGKWGEAARIAERYGFSAEEGAESLKAAAMQGLGGEAVHRVFDTERRTGADRGILSSVSYLSGRYGGGDALQAGWQGLNASNMKTAQFGEFLRGIERAMTDGIGKGFNRSSDEISKNMSMLSMMTNENPLWQGEQGANRLMKMYGGFEGATEMQSSTDVLAFRAARSILGESADYVDVMRYMENPDNFAELFNKFKELIFTVEGGDRNAMVEHFRKQYGMTYNEAITLADGGTFTDQQMRAIINRQSGMPEAGAEIAELKASIETAHIQNAIIEAGQGFWDAEIWKALEETKKQYQGTTGMLPHGGDHSYLEEGLSLSGRRGNPGFRAGANREIDSYFGDGTRQDRAASQRVQDVLFSPRRRSDEELNAADRAFNIMANLPEETKKKWDRENTLNSLADSNTAAEILAVLRQLVEIETRNGGRIEELADMNITIL